MDAGDLALLEASVASAVEAHAGSAATERALTSLGWSDMLEAEPLIAGAVVFSRLGLANATSSALDDVVAERLGLPLGPAVVHPRWGDPLPGTLSPAGSRVEGTTGPRIRNCESAYLLFADGVAVVPVSSLTIAAAPKDGNLQRAAVEGSVDGDWTPLSTRVVGDAVSSARLALGHQLHGMATAMLELSREHAMERVQFGRPIAGFQAVRHKLAETLVAVEAAGEALAAAREDPGRLSSDLARILAGRAARDAAKHGQQVLAGIGFTRDHDFHRYLFSSLETDGLYGTTEGLTKILGRQLLNSRTVPRLVEL